MPETTKKLEIQKLTHLDYDAMSSDWPKYRLTFEGGKKFVEKYLSYLSSREDSNDFTIRKSMSYCPAHAKAGILEIKNAIYQRMVDIKRQGGPVTYQESICGNLKGVDLNSSTMNGFIGTKVLPELLVMKRVGVYIDKSPIIPDSTIADNQGIHPYLYIYKAEDIRSWSFDAFNNLVSILLREKEEIRDPETLLITGTADIFRLLTLTPTGVAVRFFDKDGKERSEKSTLLQLPIIPFAIFEISNSLMVDIADYQIALLNLASSDMNYAIRSNFPFYTEQFNPGSDLSNLRPANPPTANVSDGGVGSDGTAANAAIAKDRNVKVGVAHGRRYPKGLERPAFIHPSAEPLRASMEKQETLKKEVRELLSIAVTSLQPVRQSAESKQQDNQSLEAGLSYIGLELEHGERIIARIWSAYEGVSGEGEEVIVKYPEIYSLRSDEDRQDEAERLRKILPNTPSLTAQKLIMKQIVVLTIGTKVSNDDVLQIFAEIDKLTVVVSDVATIIQDLDAGLVSEELASQLRGYPKGEVEQARKDHAERAARIVAAQSSVATRGVKDLGNDPKAANEEKKNSQEAATNQDKAGDATRGKGENNNE